MFNWIIWKYSMPGLLPTLEKNHQGQERRIGVEIEFAGVDPNIVLAILVELFGGTPKTNHVFDYSIKGSSLGDFILELDSSKLKSLGETLSESIEHKTSSHLELLALPLLSKAAELLIPWEIVTAPIPLSRYSELLPLIVKLRKAGALGTRHSLQFAFGLHLNPDLPDLSAPTILRYLRAYCCLYDWIYIKEKVDWARKVTPYIRHFKPDYIKHILSMNYQPSMDELIDDYLRFNPTRNRDLDMLPLFMFIDEKRVRKKIADVRVNARPTFHYRLPNCDIDNSEWNVDHPWKLWLEVEKLANNKSQLDELCAAYLSDSNRLTANIDSQWLKKLNQYMLGG
jgi:hypothetical protein